MGVDGFGGILEESAPHFDRAKPPRGESRGILFLYSILNTQIVGLFVGTPLLHMPSTLPSCDSGSIRYPRTLPTFSSAVIRE